MAHQCVRCASQYENNAPELLKGCKCGGRVFLFLRDHEPATPQPGVVVGKTTHGVTPLGGGVHKVSDLPNSLPSAPSSTADQTLATGSTVTVADLTDEQKAQIEKQIAPLAKEQPVSIQLDAENIRVVSKGHYLLNLKSLFAREPVVIRNSKGIYYVHFPLTKPVTERKKR